MNKLKFVFTNENTTLDYTIKNLNCNEKEFMKWLARFDYSEIEEEFGVHDFSGHVMSDEETVGFTSSEVSNERFMELMTVWFDVLKDANFVSNQEIEVIGEIEKVTINISNELLNKVIDLELDLDDMTFEDEIEESFEEYLDETLTDEMGYYEYDGLCGDGYLIQINDENDDWEENFLVVVDLIKDFFINNKINFNTSNIKDND